MNDTLGVFTPICITYQGAVRVCDPGDEGCTASRVRQSLDMMLLRIDLQSKQAKVLGVGTLDGVPEIILCAGANTIHLNDTVSRDAPTILVLPEYAGWEVEMVNCARYTLTALLTKADPAR